LLSAYYSAGKTTQFSAGDFNNGSVLKEALAARAYRQELIVICFNADAIDLTFHMARHLQQHAGYHHFLVLGPNEAGCTAFRSHWADDKHWPGCGWLSLPGDESAKHNPDDVYRLWLRRYKLVALLLERGMNVLLADADVLFHDDFYRQAKHTSLAGFNMFLMLSEINGGLLYVQNVHPDGPIIWLFNEVVRRGLLIYDYMDLTGDKVAQGCTQMDQAWLQYLLVTLSNHLDPNTWLCLPTGNGTNPLWRELASKLGQPEPLPPLEPQTRLQVAFNNTALQPPLTSRAKASACKLAGSEACERLSKFTASAYADHVDVAYLPYVSGSGKDSGAVETAVKVPLFIFGTFESTLSGWDDGHVPFATLVHLVMYGNAFNRQERGGKNNRWWLIQSHGIWFGRGGGNFQAPPPSMAEKPKYLGLHPRAAASLVNISEADYEAMFVRVATAAAEAGRIPVIPAVPCTMPWMPRSAGSRYGVESGMNARYRAMSNGLCYPLADVHGTCTLEVAMPQFLLDGAAAANAGGLRNGTASSAGYAGQLGVEADVFWVNLDELPPSNDDIARLFAKKCASYAPGIHRLR